MGTLDDLCGSEGPGSGISGSDSWNRLSESFSGPWLGSSLWLLPSSGFSLEEWVLLPLEWPSEDSSVLGLRSLST